VRLVRLARDANQAGGSLTEESGDKQDPDPEPPDLPKQVSMIVSGAAAILTVVGLITAFVTTGRFIYRIGIFVATVGAATALAGVAIWLRRSSRLSALLRRWGLITAVVAGVALITVGVTVAATHRGSPTASCHALAKVTGADTSAASFTIGVTLRCKAPAGSQLWLIEQRLNEGAAGTEKHSEYVFGWPVRNVADQRQVFTDTPPGCVARRYYLISATPYQVAVLKQSRHTASGAYYENPIDSDIGQYISSNVQLNHTCNKQS
jgi:hypothetical protein